MNPSLTETADVEPVAVSKAIGDDFRFTHWPTEFRAINQAYNNNPEYYGQFGLTGHEGLDIRAPSGSRVFAAAPGEVERIVRVAEGRPYGNAVYVRHPGGYRTAYAHLNDILVAVGEQVVGGQLIGLAGSTGNSSGAHLHLTLFLDNASNLGLTTQPRDIIDPTPYLNALRSAEWTPPIPPLVNGWGWANSIDRAGNLGRVSENVNINLRARPDQEARRIGLVPAGTVVRITGGQEGGYFPVQVAGADVTDRTAQEEVTYEYEFVRFETTVGDFTSVQPGRQFTVTWTLRNSGTAPWTGDFRLAYLDRSVEQTANHVRHAMSGKSSYTLQELLHGLPVQPGETATISLTLSAPVQVGWYAAHWVLQTAQGETIDEPLWLRINVVGNLQPQPQPPPQPQPQPEAQTEMAFGMNINPNNGHSLDVERMRGMEWVRFPFWASREQNSPEEALQKRYGHVIQSYASAGIKSLLVLIQDTEWGNAPWDNGNWQEYARVFAKTCGRVARACSVFGDSVAYQVWNEEDSGFGADAPFANPSAIGIAPENYALLLEQAVPAIRQNHPGATVVMGGLKTGPENAAEYLRRVRQRLNGHLLVDAIAAHPYGRYVNHAPFNYRDIGRLWDAQEVFKNQFPNLPLWITEIGVPGHGTVLGPEHWQSIATYMREVVEDVAGHHRAQVPVLIWFAWSDMMENSGIVTAGGQMKEHIGDVFELMKRLGGDQSKGVGLGEPAAEFLRFETTLENHNAVPAGSSFTNRWVFENTGDTTWDDSYRLVYMPENSTGPMVEQTSFSLDEVVEGLPVEPGEEAAIELALTAPEQAGRNAVSRWQLRDDDGNAFAHLYADITTTRRSTVGTGARQANMAFVADHTIPDDTRIGGGQPFVKQWRVQNTGDRQWGDGFRLVFVEGDLQMARGVASHMVPTTGREEEVILTVPMVAPLPRHNQPTGYSSLWRLQDDRGNYFGEAVWARIVSLPGPMAEVNLGRFGNPSGWYSQNDPRWASTSLGNGQQTIGSWGCLLTCQAMMLTAYGLPLSPADVNQRLRQLGRNGFNGSVVQFAGPTHLLPGLTQGANLRSRPDSDVPGAEWTGEDPIERIDRALAAGHTVLAQVDQSPNDAFYRSSTDQHWVILVARTPDGADYLMLDPITAPRQLRNQPLSLMRKYGNPAPSRTHEENLRDAIKSALIYRYNG